MQVGLDSDLAGAAVAATQVPIWFEAWEQCLSRFRPDSELSALNRSRDTWMPVSDVLWQVLQAALAGAHQSGGLVLPTLLAPLTTAGYDRSFDEVQARAQDAAQAQFHLVPAVNLQASIDSIELDTDQCSVCLRDGIQLDLGGVAKGWCADTAVQRLAKYGPVLIDAGGDIAIGGPVADDAPIVVGVANPIRPDEVIAALALGPCGVATSGRDYRRWQYAGALQHHIIDPRTSRPAQTDVLSATVIAPNAITAEVAAKRVFILGSEAGMGWLNAQPDLAGLLVLESGHALVSSRWAEYLSA